jgi:predicted dehydrogenase
MTSGIKETRRSFIRKSVALGAAVSAPTILPSKVLGRNGSVAPSEKITMGIIGIGPRCTSNVKAMLQLPDLQFVAIADVQANRRDAGKKLVDEYYGNDSCVLYRDFRELLERKDIDTVMIATGDRWHGPASIMAARAGKDIYSEKPCGLTIEKCQQLADTIEETGRVFQAGTQRRSVPNFQQAVALAHSGKLGQLRTLYASVYTPVINTEWLPGEQAPPRYVCDWNLWLGPVPWRPYNKEYVYGGWRTHYDFDSGMKLLDWGAHTLDLCQWANQADDTMPVEYVPGEKTITCHYENGVKLILDFLETPFGERPGWVQELSTCPVRFVGDEGSVETGDSGGIVTSPASLMKELPEKGKQVRGLEVSAHARDFLDCVRSRSKPAANHLVMRRSHIACHAAALSWLLGRKLRLDPETETFIDDPEANSLRSRPERDPWKT